MADQPHNGFSISDWVAIGLFLAGGVSAFLWYLWTRFVARIEKLWQGLYGEHGVIHELRERDNKIEKQILQECVTQEDFGVEVSKQDRQFNELRAAQGRLESRLGDKMDGMTKVLLGELGGLRKDIAGTNQRIDNALNSRRNH